MSEENEIIKTLVENLYFAIIEGNGTKFEIYSFEKLARAYSIAKQLYEYGGVDINEVESFVNAVNKVTK